MSFDEGEVKGGKEGRKEERKLKEDGEEWRLRQCGGWG